MLEREGLDLDTIVIAKGSHATRDDGVCAMELVAWIAGEPHSDTPQCACPVLTTFIQHWNDALDDEPRNRLLKPIVPRLVGTRGATEIAERRSYLALDWLIREATPAWLDLMPSLAEHAAALRGLGPIVTIEDARLAGPIVRRAAKQSAAAGDAAWAAALAATKAAARAAAWAATRAAAMDTTRAAAGDAAWSAAKAAAWAAAWAASMDAARDTVMDAAMDAAGSAAWAAARAAAMAAARDAAWDAAWDAARGVLRPTEEALQVSAVQLVERMLTVGSAAGVSDARP